jgi:type IV pilus assembly protein PilW
LGTNVFYDGTVRSNPGALPSDGGILAPVRIIEGASGASDEIVIVRSDAEFGNLAMQVRSVDLASSPPNLTVDSWPDSTSGALRLGQVFLLGKADGSKVCSLLQMTKATNVGAGLAPWKLEFGYNPTSYPYNPSTPTVFASFPTYGDGDVIVNLGDSAKYVAATQEGNLSVGRAGFVYRRYGIHCDKLAAVDPSQTAGPYDCANTTPLVDEIVDIQAQYGIAPAGSQSVSEWRNATGTWAFNSVAAADIARIKAVRISVVARSPQYEKPDPSYSGGHVSPATLDLWVKVNAGDDPAPVYTVPDRDYRYKVFTTIVPMKNVIWGRL